MRITLAACFFCASILMAQTDATVSGTVTDPTGANVAGASIAATGVATGVTTKTQSNDAGVYSFPALPPGRYRITGEHQGFRRAVFNDVELEVGARLTLNIPLELGATTESVEVTGAGGEVGYATASVGSVVSGRKILELPLAGRSAYDLLTTQAGVYGANFSGNRTGSLNITTDGINAQDNLLNGMFYVGVANQVRLDRVEEFRIITSPTDAELGRGSGQVQVITRMGGNAFHGAVWEEHRNTVFNANTWFNNQLGTNPLTGDPVSPRNILIRNQYGGRLGGPIKRNRTFFNGYYEGERQRQRNATTATVLTEPARRGLFRFFPGAQNANANASNPTVDLQGNPVRPPNATGDLQSVSVFGRDPNRMTPDGTGIVNAQIGLTTLPNNFRAGDGLNTAGFTWSRPVHIQFETYEVRVDHQFSAAHRMTVSFSHQAYDSLDVTGAQPLPTSPGGRGPTETTQYTANFTSVLKPNLLNEFRAGIFRPRTEVVAPYDPKSGGPNVLSRNGEIDHLVDFLTFTEPVSPTNFGADNSNRISPVYQWGDNISWLKGRHSFKGGAELRWVSSAGYDAFAVTPRANIGAGAVPVQNINTIAGIGQNTGGAQNLLLDLSGSLGSGSGVAYQVYNSPGGSNPVYLSGQTRYRNWSQHEFSWFFKDEIKVNPNLTVNLGIRYEWYAVPHERQAKALALVGGAGGLFSISGTSFADLFQPGRINGSPSRVQLIGPGTPNPDISLYRGDHNNYSPNVGIAWSLPWFGKGKTILRTGYGLGYERNPIYLTHDVSGLLPGLSETSAMFSPTLATLANLRLPVPPAGLPLTPIPITARTTQTFRAFDDNLRNPYIQNFNFSLTRTLPGNSRVDVRYVGSKATKLVRSANINEANIFENGILDAYKAIQSGGASSLMDRIFGAGGSDLVRSNSSIQGVFSNNSVASLASLLSTTNLVTGQTGGLLRRAGLGENFVFANPAVSSALLVSNFGSSTYHSMQVEWERRLSNDLTVQANYTWSRTLGEYDGDDSALGASFRTLRDRSLDKRLLPYHRLHVFRSNGLWELPFGPGRMLGRGLTGPLARIAGGWQIGAIFNAFSGEAISFGAVNAFNSAGTATPVVAGDLFQGHVTMTGNGPVFFTGLQQVVDPYVARITTLNGIQGRSTLRAIADSSGRIILQNPEPGQFGTLAPTSLYGPGTFRLDVNLLKRIKITERTELQLRADAINFTNTPQFGNPNLDINSLNFGRITGTSTANGGQANRIIVFQGRFSW